MLGGATVAWNLRKEPVVSLSSCEVEYLTTLLCACQVKWMMNLVEEITGGESWSNDHEDL